MPKTCYFCDRLPTSKEHVPPQCIFPAQKDTPDGRNYRNNLITVPSCDEHNCEKSEDDTYLMMVLVSYFHNNEAAQNQIKSKVARAWTKDHKLAKTVVKNLQQIHVLGELQHAYEIDTDRFDRALELIAHGLHFHTLKSRPPHSYRTISYPLAQLEGAHANQVNLLRARILTMANEMLMGIPIAGSNKEIFWFQISPDVDGTHVVRMCFFEAFVVVALSSPTIGANSKKVD